MRRLRSFVFSGVSLTLAVLPMVQAGAAEPEAVRCAALQALQVPGMSFEVTGAEWKPAHTLSPPPFAPSSQPPVSLPAYCRVDGVIDRRTGRDGKPYAIGFAVALPANWNGRFLMQGGGAYNGSVAEPLGGWAAGTKPALARGFAVASTDTGHVGELFDDSFLADQEAALNYYYRALDKVTVVAKQFVSGYYGSAAHHSYFAGCSTGGREAMLMSQRLPDYYEGILAGAPGMRNNHATLNMRWISTVLNGVAPRDQNGQPQTRLALSATDRKLVVEGVLAACDAQDGAADGLVSAPQSCRFDPTVLACTGAKAEGCLSSAQVDAVKKVMSGLRTSDGRQVYPGYYWDTGIGAEGGIPGPLAGPFRIFSDTDMDVDAEAARVRDGHAMLWDTDAWTNLSTFRGRGGKLIFLHGVSDGLYSAQDTVDYYERLAADNKPARTEDWSLLFLVPGMGHCGGGAKTLDIVDLIDPLVAWVEQGRTPERVEATGGSMPGVSRPLCPYPKHAHYTGSGDVNVAASHACRE